MIVDDDVPLLSALIYAVVGGDGGWARAFTSLNNAYRRAYKTRIIPHLPAVSETWTTARPRSPT